MAHYTPEGILAQVHAAFGQGAGYIRISHDAMLALDQRYRQAITEEVIEGWGGEAVQVLERIRAIGRLAASMATTAGMTVIGPDLVTKSSQTVETASLTSWCPKDPGG